MLEVFNTNKFDNEIAVFDGKENYTFYDLKCLIASEINYLKNKKENVIISTEDNFSFIIQFFASLFCDKNIYLITDKTRLNDINFEYDILEGYQKKSDELRNFNINIRKPQINFCTSGSSGRAKIITKSLYNLIEEAKDISEQFNFSELYSISTTTMCHLFGLTFHLMVSLYNKIIINTQEILYPENIDKENTILISTPTFLRTVKKSDIPFKTAPKYIITAGSKLDSEIFRLLEKKSKIIEIYGSSETGVIANKTHYCDDFKLFNNVDAVAKEDGVEIKSEYFYEDKITIKDCVEINNRYLKINKRADRLLKIYEKRINADELEEKLKLSLFAKSCYITKNEDKLVCLCALSKSGKEYLLKNNITDLIKNLKQHLRNYSEIIPQRWKFIDEIPMTKSGKVNKNLIEHLFDVNLSLPVILERNYDKNSITYKLFFYHQCNFFKGHFPDFKLVPGVVQLYLAKELINLHFNLSLGQGQWKRIKFSNIITPDSIVNLKLEKDEKQVSYEFYSDTKKYASGTFLCQNIFERAL